MRVLQIVGGRSPDGTRDNIFVHRQIASLKTLIPDMKIIYAGLGSRAADMLKLSRQLRLAIKSFKPDVIHSQYATVTGAVTLLNCGAIPVVISFGGDEIYGTYVNEHSTKSWRTKLALWFSKYCARKASICIAKNLNMGQLLKKWGAERVDILPNGVNLNIFKELDQKACRAKLGLKNEIQYVVFAIRDQDFVKRLDLAESAVNICNNNGSRKTELLILDKVKPSLMPIYLNAGDALLLCSNHEGSPNIVKEALACNRPVVSTDVGDVRERFKTVKGLFLVHSNPENIANGLLTAMRYKKSNGRNYVENISEEKVAQRLYQIYYELQSSSKKQANSIAS